MLRISEGKTEEAWQDLLACHRLGHFVSCGGTIIEGLVGVAIDNIAFRADLVFLERAKPNGAQIRGYLADLQKLSAHPPLADKVDLAERFMLLETVFMMDRRGVKYLRGLGRLGNVVLGAAIQESVDWDPALKNANKWYDRLVLAMRIKDRPQRLARMEEVAQE